MVPPEIHRDEFPIKLVNKAAIVCGKMSFWRRKLFHALVPLTAVPFRLEKAAGHLLETFNSLIVD